MLKQVRPNEPFDTPKDRFGLRIDVPFAGLGVREVDDVADGNQLRFYIEHQKFVGCCMGRAVWYVKVAFEAERQA